MTFWAFAAIYLLVDTFVFLRGYDTFIWTHKTDAEKDIQRRKIYGDNARQDLGEMLPWQCPVCSNGRGHCECE